YKLGYLAYVNGEYRFAINWLNEYHERLKPTAASENFLASCHLRLGEFRNALDIYQRIAPRDEVTQWLQRVCSQGRTRQNKDWHGRKTTPMQRLQSLRWRNDILRDTLKHQARTLSEIDTLINSFQYVSDERLFKEVDYWQMPSQFEANRRGDCEDFALWVWIQLLRMNIRARFFLGGWYHEEINHAWVCIYDRQGVHLLECTPQDVNRPIPVRSAYDYVPVLSIDKSLIWYRH
ncbi:MAG: transglutaminase-like cysteine peptidase, partial [Candidatus Omnitrophica bacterium]|nr:transglutaminase-like cysteine peptidase [Candidatus Omnitrophota bacterium]